MSSEVFGSGDLIHPTFKHDSECLHGNKHNDKHDKDGTNVEDGKDSQKGQVLIPESAKTENGDSPAEQLADLIPKKNQEEYYEYDALGRATKAKDSAGQTVTYAYSESGTLQEMGYPDETTESILSGDSAGEVITDTLTGAGAGLLSGGAFGALGYGANKLVTGIKSVVNSGSSNAGSVVTDNKITSTIADTIDDTDEIRNFSDLMSSEDAARYNKYWDTQETIAKQKQQINEFEEGIKKGVQYSNKQKGNYGEMKMDQYYENLGFERVSSSTVTSLDDPIHHGIDGVYKNKTTGELIVAEAKYNSGRLNTKTGQRGEKWISKNINDAVNETTVKALQNQGYTSNLYNIKADGSIRFDVLDSRAKVIPDL